MVRLGQSARQVALGALYRIEVQGAFTALALDEALQRYALEGRDRALATELVYGVVRRQNTLDWAVAQVADRPPAKMDPWVRLILRQAAYQLLYLDKVPVHAVLHEAVELAKRHGRGGQAARYVNGVLRALQRRLPGLNFPDRDRDPVGYLVVAESHPPWLVARWLERLGPTEAAAALQAGNRVPALTVRVNRLKATRDEAATALAEAGLEALPARHSGDGLVLVGLAGTASLQWLPVYREGWITPQDESSMLVAPVVAPQPGDLVLDVAAAPGGKATHLAERMQDRGRVVAMDIHAHKLTLVESACRRLGLTCVETLLADGRTSGERFAGQADRVLVDAPCSGLGTLARRPDARWKKQESDVAALAQVQGEILAGAAPAVKPGGVLVYSTCTTEPEENQDLVGRFLAAHPDFRADDLTPYLPLSLQSEPGASAGMLQLWPHRHGTDGFFLARLRRVQ